MVIKRTAKGEKFYENCEIQQNHIKTWLPHCQECQENQEKSGKTKKK